MAGIQASTGLITGIPIQDTVDKLMTIASQPKTNLTARTQTLQSQKLAVQQLTSLLLAMNMAATLFGMTVDECVAGVTREAARALGLEGETGTLEAGKLADMAIWDVERPAELVYRMGFNPLHARMWRGR